MAGAFEPARIRRTASIYNRRTILLDHRFGVNPFVLIPRQETEILADKAIKYLSETGDAKIVLDLCTGSGALAISIAIACPNIKVIASDISEEALVIAERNSAALGGSDRVDFIKSDLFSYFDRGAYGKMFDLVVTNPPYIRTGDLPGLAREIRDYEPASALDGGIDGLDFFHRIAADARAYMRPDACLMTEIGADQAEDVKEVFSGAGFTKIEIFRDLSNRARILKAF